LLDPLDMTTRNEIENRDAVIDVLLISENRLLREALTKVLVRKSDLRVTSAATCGLEVVRTVDSQRLDVVVVEARMLDQACRGTVLAIMQDRPDVRVLAIGADSDESGFLSGVRAGVAGYLPQDASAAEVAAAVRTVARGGAVCPPKLCRALFEEVARHWGGSIAGKTNERRGVSRRELEILELVDAGLGNKEIANELRLSEQTVKNHMQRVFRRLGVGDRLEAVELCRDRGWITQIRGASAAQGAFAGTAGR
jgi:DNA-binding NarL/FixJ family response regulator